MALREFTKMHGIGNDFVVFDATREPLSLTADQARHIADRREGIGCDQILLLESPPSPEVDFGYRILNSDGSESGQCGNGARCIAVFARERGLSDSGSLKVRTISGDMRLQHLPDGDVRVDMGEPRYAPEQIPFLQASRKPRYHMVLDDDEGISFGAVSMGNPHAVIEVTDLRSAPVERLGQLLQERPEFPESVNVGFMQILNAQEIALRVYERGAGETRACGSGACAAVAVGVQQGKLAQSVKVSLPGGILQIDWQGEGHHLYMSGPATSVYSGKIAL